MPIVMYLIFLLLRSCSTSLFIISISVATFLIPASVSVGINYGQIANNLPHPEDVKPLLKSIGATRVKLYDADPHILKAFANSGLEFIVSLGNEYLAKIRDPKQILSWVKSNVQSYLPSTKITSIVVVNEVLTLNDSVHSSNLLPAMDSIHRWFLSTSTSKLWLLQLTIWVSWMFLILPYQASYGYYSSQSGHFAEILVKNSGIFYSHCKVGSPFLINAYPCFAYKANPKQVSLDFVLFEARPGTNLVDPVSGLRYDNMFHAQIDAAYSAIEKLLYKNVCLQISETGWPSKGDAEEAGARPENACKYNGNFLKFIAEKKGTPMRPNLNLNIHLFALFNENLKPDPTLERNFGLFKPDGTPVYNMGFNVTGLQSGNSSEAATPSSSSPAWSGSTSSGYLSITANEAGKKVCLRCSLLLVVLAMAFTHL